MRILKRIVLWLVGIITALALGLVASIAVEGWLGNGRIDTLTNTRMSSAGGPDVRAFVARPDGPGPYPAVIMVHEWWGLNKEVVEKAEELAKQGYVVVAPDTLRGSSTGWIPRAIYQVATVDTAQVNSDVDAVYTWLAAQPDVVADKIAIMGFCYGGRTSLLYSIHNPQIAATGIFYGMADTTPQQLETLGGPVLGIWGGADASIPLAEVDTLAANLEAAGVPHTFRVFENQPHAFVKSVDEIRQGGAQGEAWNDLLVFLDGALKASGSTTPAAPFDAPARSSSTTLAGVMHHWFVCKLSSL